MRSFETFEVVRGVWCVRHRRRRSCADIVKTSPGAVLIDAGPDPSAHGIMMGLQEARVGFSSVRALVLTYWHSDHTAGARAFAARAKTPILYAAAAAPLMTGEQALPADRLLSADDIVEDCLRVVAPEGPESARLSLYLERDRLIFTGDAARDRAGCDWICPAHGEPQRART